MRIANSVAWMFAGMGYGRGDWLEMAIGLVAVLAIALIADSRGVETL